MALLVLAVFGRWPYGFYSLLRLIVCGSAVYLAVRAHATRDTVWLWTMVAVAVLFNPLSPVHLPRAYWQPLDLIVAGIFCVWMAQARR